VLILEKIANGYPQGMTAEEIRLKNLKALVEEHGSIVAVANRAETAPAYISQILNRVKSRTGKERDVGADLARKLEDGFGKPRGWMDTDHDNGPLPDKDAQFLNVLKEDFGKYEVPEHIRQTIITLIESSPKRTSD